MADWSEGSLGLVALPAVGKESPACWGRDRAWSGMAELEVPGGLHSLSSDRQLDRSGKRSGRCQKRWDTSERVFGVRGAKEMAAVCHHLCGF